jgi:hypothetical protein
VTAPARPATARDVAVDLGRRIADPAVLAAAVAAARRDSTLPAGVQWRPHSLAAGYAGTAVLFAALDAADPDAGWDRTGHAHLAAAVSAAGARGTADPSLYAGLAGVGVAAVRLAAGRDRYRGLLASLDAALLPRVEEAARRLDTVAGCGVGVFDLISGLTGSAVYLLARRDDASARRVLRAVLGALARLLADDGDPRRWHTPAAHQARMMAGSFPAGAYNCGLAHGVPGPLALLAIAAGEGLTVPGTDAALDAAVRFLVDQHAEGPWGPDWPNVVGLVGGPSLERPVAGPARSAWCYGAPGVARALWLAGTALGDGSTRELAVRTVEAALARPAQQRGLTSPTFCHGTAGLLRIAVRFARDTGSAALTAGAEGLVTDLLDHHEPASLLGFRTVEPGGVRVDQPGLLDGAAGVALTLLATGPDEPDPSWDRLFLLG